MTLFGVVLSEEALIRDGGDEVVGLGVSMAAAG